MLRELFEKSGLTVVTTKLQKKFPKELFPVRMYQLKPNASPAATSASAATTAPTAASTSTTASSAAANGSAKK